ncbi:MAG: DUF4199 domain-containing protein [Paludibacteraceae bacterium]|nr:DUF4199 domain-containing protein [Paludibacteraceae bacterium]
MTTAETNTPSPIHHAMQCGLDMGVWFAANFVLSAQQEAHPFFGVIGFFVQIYIIFGVYRLAHHYKHVECKDQITFGQAYRYILWLFVFSSLVAALIRFIYLQWIDTTYLSRVYAIFSSTPELQAQVPNTEVYEAMLHSIRALLTPIRFAVYSIFADILSGAFLGLIMAPFVSRFNRKFFDNNQFNNQ